MVPRRDQGNAQLANQQGEAMTDVAANQKVTSTDYAHGISFGEAFVVWLRVAMLSFGGPAGQIAVMHRILVEEKNWISEGRFLHALNYCMLLPGPEAQQLATHIGWLLHRTAGGIMAGVLFIVPGVIAIMGLSYIYAVYGNVGFVEALFFGLKAAVLAIVIQAVFRVGKRALRNRVMIAIAALAFIAIFFFGAPFPLIIVAAGLVGFAGARAGRPEFAAIEHGGKGNAADDNVMGAPLNRLSRHSRLSDRARWRGGRQGRIDSSRLAANLRRRGQPKNSDQCLAPSARRRSRRQSLHRHRCRSGLQFCRADTRRRAIAGLAVPEDCAGGATQSALRDNSDDRPRGERGNTCLTTLAAAPRHDCRVRWHWQNDGRPRRRRADDRCL
jgi:chromate transport protein ChrA